MNTTSSTWTLPSSDLGSSPDRLPVHRPAYLDAVPLLRPKPPELDSTALCALFAQLWVRRDEPDHYVRQEPYTGGLIRVAQAVRHALDAETLTYTLKVGDPADPEVAYQLTRAVQGMTDAAAMIEMPLTGEIVYEPKRGLWPELDVCAHVHATDGTTFSVSARQPASCSLPAGDLLAVAGRMTNDLSGSLALDTEDSLPPPIDLVAEQRVIDSVRDCSALISAAVPIGRGGLLITLARCCAQSGLGARVKFATAWRDLSPVAVWFGEAQSRFLLWLSREHWADLEEAARPLEVPLQELGTAGGSRLVVEGAVNLDLGEVQAWS